MNVEIKEVSGSSTPKWNVVLGGEVIMDVRNPSMIDTDFLGQATETVLVNDHYQCITPLVLIKVNGGWFMCGNLKFGSFAPIVGFQSSMTGASQTVYADPPSSMVAMGGQPTMHQGVMSAPWLI